jgi:hypothetical protein
MAQCLRGYEMEKVGERVHDPVKGCLMCESVGW